jgi:hypothetical protein
MPKGHRLQRLPPAFPSERRPLARDRPARFLIDYCETSPHTVNAGPGGVSLSTSAIGVGLTGGDTLGDAHYAQIQAR